MPHRYRPPNVPPFQSDGSSEVVNRWELIETALLGRPICNSRDLETAILSYNSKYAKSWSFRALHVFFEADLEDEECALFFNDILPRIIRLALQLPTLIPCSIPLLKCGQNMSLSMSQQQISCLLANAFLCTFPRRNTQKFNSEYKHFPDVNFNRLFQSPPEAVAEKLKCLFNYFRRVTTPGRPPIGVVTFRRRSLPPKCIPKFSESEKEIRGCHLVVRSRGTIEADGKGLLQVDFANKAIGGGVLGQGCVQEEIRFLICPELFVTRLFTEILRPEEALFIIGAEQFSLYTGYASSFEWAGNYVDPTPLDGNQRRQCQIVAIDALPFRDPKHQYRTELIQRELTKAYVGYARLQQQQRVAPGVASGNWGCGAFNGDAHLKSLIQLMICAVAERPLVYFTFGDQSLVRELEEIYGVLCEKRVTVGALWEILVKFGTEKKNPDGDELFGFIKKQLESAVGKEGENKQTMGCGSLWGKWGGGGREANMSSLYSFNRKNPQKKIEEQKRPVEETGRDYSDTDDEEEQLAEQRKKKLTSPEGNGGREKMAKMSLADCLDSYFAKENNKVQGAGACSSTMEGEEGTVTEGPVKTKDVKEQVEEEGVDQKIEGVGDLKEDEKAGDLDVIVQIDEDGGEFIDATPPSQDSHYMGKQTKLLDFFKIKNGKK